jgi:biopolymer transport protein ExbB
MAFALGKSLVGLWACVITCYSLTAVFRTYYAIRRMTKLWTWFELGGFIMYPLLLCSLAVWIVLIERFLRFRSVSRALPQFQLEAVNALLRQDLTALRSVIQKHQDLLPPARSLSAAIERMESEDPEIKSAWKIAFDRARMIAMAELKDHLWILGTIGGSAPFIGLFGTVVGILRSFNDMARAGAGGFAVVASGISEALIATAAGLIVAIIAVIAYNIFQVRFQKLALQIRISSEELIELLEKRYG